MTIYPGRLRSFALSPLLILIAAVQYPATATTVTFQFIGPNPSPYAVFGRSVINPATNTRVNTAAMQGGRFELNDLGTGTFTGDFNGIGNLFWAFCIEPNETIGAGTYTLDVAPLEQGTTNIGGMGVAKADKLRELFGRYYPDFSVGLTRLQAGALQIAVWEIVREDSGVLNVLSGDIFFYTNSSTSPAGVVALAQTYVQSINGSGPRAENLIALTRVGTQDLIVQVESVPEPATFAMIGLGLIAVAWRRKRASRRS